MKKPKTTKQVEWEIVYPHGDNVMMRTLHTKQELKVFKERAEELNIQLDITKRTITEEVIK